MAVLSQLFEACLSSCSPVIEHNARHRDRNCTIGDGILQEGAASRQILEGAEPNQSIRVSQRPTSF